MPVAYAVAHEVACAVAYEVPYVVTDMVDYTVAHSVDFVVAYAVAYMWLLIGLPMRLLKQLLKFLSMLRNGMLCSI